MIDAGYSCHETEFGWVSVKAYPGAFTYDEALAMCSGDGTDVKAELPAPLNSFENELLKNKASDLGVTGSFWLGINDRDMEGVYRDQHGSLHNYFRWGSNEPTPDNSGGIIRDCVQKKSSASTWETTSCFLTNDVICTRVEGKAIISIKVQ